MKWMPRPLLSSASGTQMGVAVEAAATVRHLDGHLVVVAEEAHADVVVGAVGRAVHERVGERLGDRDAELEQVGSAKARHLRERRDTAARRRQSLRTRREGELVLPQRLGRQRDGSSPGATSTDGCGSGALTRPACASSALAAGSSTATTNSLPQR